MPKWLRSLLEALGLVQRETIILPPRPTPPTPVPSPTPQEETEFWPPFIMPGYLVSWGQRVSISLGGEEHGCGASLQRYGIKDAVRKGIRFMVTVWGDVAQMYYPIFDPSGVQVNGKIVPGPVFYLFGGWVGSRPPFPMLPQHAPAGCVPNPVPPPPDKPKIPENLTVRCVAVHPDGSTQVQEVTIVLDRAHCLKEV